MLSRVADSIYWTNRYIERAEDVSRLIDVNLHLMLDLPAGTADLWGPLLNTAADPLLFQERFGEVTRDNVVAFLTFDSENPNSIYSCLRAARENARSVRQIITSEMWEQINKFYLMVRATSAAGPLASPHEFFTEVKMASHLYEGINDSTMSHNEGWYFGRLGRLLERADMTSRILDTMYASLLPPGSAGESHIDDVPWSALLKAVSAFEMYRHSRGRITSNDVADFLILDHAFPRSIRFCVVEANESVHAVSNSSIDGFQNMAEQRLAQQLTELNQAHIQGIISSGLHEFLVDLRANLNRVGDAIVDTFFGASPRAVISPNGSGNISSPTAPSSLAE